MTLLCSKSTNGHSFYSVKSYKTGPPQSASCTTPASIISPPAYSAPPPQATFSSQNKSDRRLPWTFVPLTALPQDSPAIYVAHCLTFLKTSTHLRPSLATLCRSTKSTHPIPSIPCFPALIFPYCISLSTTQFIYLLTAGPPPSECMFHNGRAFYLSCQYCILTIQN